MGAARGALAAIGGIGLIYPIAAVRYRSRIPMLYMLGLVEYLVRALCIPAYKQIETVGAAPGPVGKVPLAAFSLVMLLLGPWPREAGAGDSHERSAS